MQIKAYTKKELAVQYFPDVLPRTAVKRLMRWINRCQPLKDELRMTDLKLSCRTFTPRQVALIIEYLGAP